MSTHRLLAGLQIHEPYHFVQESDPGSVGSNLYWLKVSTGELKRRNSANSTWISIGGGGAFIGLSDVPASYSGQGSKGIRVNAGATGLEFYTITAGATAFTGLSDVPATYTGQALKLTRVNAAENALEFFTNSGQFVSVPSSSVASGSAGQYSADATYFYFYASTQWKRIAGGVFGGVALTYASDGDANGAMYFRGTSDGAVAWANPSTSANIVAVFSSTFSGTPAALVDRTANTNFTNDVANSWYAFDLGAAHTLIVNRYSIRHKSTAGDECIRSWRLEGSNSSAGNSVAQLNAASWTTIDTQIGNTTIAAANAWVSPVVVGQVTGYRWLRIVQTAVNSSGTNYFASGEFEFYGTMNF